MNPAEIKDFLEEKYDLYNRVSFIETDPISVPHRFSKKEDIEISAFLTATIAWGNRTSIIKNATRLMNLMSDEPYEFITKGTSRDHKKLETFVHRTFNGGDAIGFTRSLKNIYTKHGGLEKAFNGNDARQAIIHFRKLFLAGEFPKRAHKHVSDPEANSSAKRLNMFLRWMVRKDKRGVDFGIWNNLSASALSCPLDVHSGNVARKLKLLKRKQNDWKAVEELDRKLRSFDPGDPVKYDFALFGLGVFEKF